MPIDNPFGKPPEIKPPEMPTVEMPPAEPIKEELVVEPLAEPAYTRVRGKYMKLSANIKTTAKTKAEVLKQYGLESNIPINHPYWKMKA